MTRDLRAEVVAFLEEHGPSTSPEIGLGVRARRSAVEAVLAQEGFSVAQHRAGAHSNAVLYVSSRPVPRITVGSRAGLLLSILRGGEWHSRDDIFERAGRSFLTNNAASDLRAAGHVVEYSAKRGYRLVSLAAPEAPTSPLPTSGAASDTDGWLAAPEGSAGGALLVSAPSGAASESADSVAA